MSTRHQVCGQARSAVVVSLALLLTRGCHWRPSGPQLAPEIFLSTSLTRGCLEVSDAGNLPCLLRLGSKRYNDAQKENENSNERGGAHGCCPSPDSVLTHRLEVPQRLIAPAVRRTRTFSDGRLPPVHWNVKLDAALPRTSGGVIEAPRLPRPNSGRPWPRQGQERRRSRLPSKGVDSTCRAPLSSSRSRTQRACHRPACCS